MAATPRPSATVVLVRDTEHGPEFLLVRRRAGDAFGEAYTFPGGVLDDDESKARRFCTGLAAAEADALLGLDSGALDYYSAVVRELYEETGLFLGCAEPVDPVFRGQLYTGALPWTDFLEQQQLEIRCDALHYFTHWITPSTLPKRWTTRFFVAAAPDKQEPEPDGCEITDLCWLTADEALASAKSRLRDVPYPTCKTLEDLAHLKSFEDMIAWARQRQQQGIPAIQPELRTEQGKRRIFMPEIGE